MIIIIAGTKYTNGEVAPVESIFVAVVGEAAASSDVVPGAVQQETCDGLDLHASTKSGLEQ